MQDHLPKADNLYDITNRATDVLGLSVQDVIHLSAWAELFPVGFRRAAQGGFLAYRGATLRERAQQAAYEYALEVITTAARTSYPNLAGMISLDVLTTRIEYSPDDVIYETVTGPVDTGVIAVRDVLSSPTVPTLMRAVDMLARSVRPDRRGEWT